MILWCSDFQTIQSTYVLYFLYSFQHKIFLLIYCVFDFPQFRFIFSPLYLLLTLTLFCIQCFMSVYKLLSVYKSGVFISSAVALLASQFSFSFPSTEGPVSKQMLCVLLCLEFVLFLLLLGLVTSVQCQQYFFFNFPMLYIPCEFVILKFFL